MTTTERALLLIAMDRDPLVQIGIHRGPGVVLPEGLALSVHMDISLNIESGNPQNNLNLSLLDDGLSGTFSFNRVPFDVFVPWRAITRIFTDNFVVIFTDRIGPSAEPISQKPALRRVK